jgi:TRAP-type C4-dicarboxylate transport system permease small subunit
MRALLARVFDAAAYAAAAFMIGTLVFVLLGVLGRVFGFHLRGTDAYAGYCMAACGFLALAHTLGKNEHIRVTLVLDHVGPRVRRGLELFCLAVGTALAGLLAWYSVRLAWQSHAYNDISTATDATPLWIPQLGMAAGALLLALAFAEAFLGALRGETPTPAHAAQEPARVE